MTIRYAANLSMLWTDRPPIDRFSAAADAGFCNVEMLFPQTLPYRELQGALDANQLTMSLFDFHAGNFEAGERGIAALPDRVEEFRSQWQSDLELATKLGTRTMTVLAGIRSPGADPKAYDDILVDNLRSLGELAAPLGITVTLEAINNKDIPGFHVRTVDQAAGLIAAVDLENVQIQLDQYHVSRESEDPIAQLEKHFGRVGHVQIADSPGRHEPGTGTAPIRRFLETLDTLGYGGLVGLEYSPSTDTDASLAWLSRPARCA